MTDNFKVKNFDPTSENPTNRRKFSALKKTTLQETVQYLCNLF